MGPSSVETKYQKVIRSPTGKPGFPAGGPTVDTNASLERRGPGFAFLDHRSSERLTASSKIPTSTSGGYRFPTAGDTVVIIPAYQEAGAIGAVIDELRGSIDPMVLVVDRPGDDGTGSVARGKGALVLDQTDRGKGNAIRLGLDFVRRYCPQVQYVGLVDADHTYPTASLAEMREILRTEPSTGMVVGLREHLRNNGTNSLLFAIGNRMLARCHATLNGIPLRDPLSGLRLVRFDALEKWSPKARGFDVECELNHQVHNVQRLSISEIPIPYRTRIGKKKLRLRHGVSIFGRMVALSLGGKLGRKHREKP